MFASAYVFLLASLPTLQTAASPEWAGLKGLEGEGANETGVDAFKSELGPAVQWWGPLSPTEKGQLCGGDLYLAQHGVHLTLTVHDDHLTFEHLTQRYLHLCSF